MYKTLGRSRYGQRFDFFGEISHHGTDLITPDKPPTAASSEMLWPQAAPYPEEWWHYSLVGERTPDTYF